MKRDLDLIRLLLAEFEKLPLNGFVEARSISLEPWTADEVVYNTFLMEESGLITGKPSNSRDGKTMLVMSLTSAGHDYLDAVRNDTIWGKVRARLELEGTAGGLEIAKALAISIAMKKLGLKD